jgi:putative ABC transport system substrate-binding protein
MIRRRVLVTGGLAVLANGPARAQRQSLIGYLSGRSLGTDAHLLQAAKDGLKESGFVEGQNVAFEYRWADGKFERLEALAAELVARKPDLLMAVGGTPVPFAAKKATSSLPIIFTLALDPSRQGLIASLARPGGTVTGAVLLASALEGKRIDLLHTMRPAARSMALLVNPTNGITEELQRDALAAASALGVTVEVVRASTVAELDRVLAGLSASKPDGLAVAIDSVLIAERRRIVSWAAEHKVPAIYPSREFTDDGGLASYAARWVDAYRWAGVYAGRVLKGARPGDLPVQQPTAYELVVNRRTARTLGLTLPPAFMARADEVIE